MKPVNNDIDIGLAALVLNAKPDQTLSCVEIAEVCNCNRSYINWIERTALRKARILADRKQLNDFLKD